MAEGRWINVPGKGRRWQMPSGEIRMIPPTDSALDFIGDAFNALGGAYQANRRWVNEHNERVRRQQAANQQPLQTMMGSAYTKPATPTVVDPLALREKYMATVEGPVRTGDMDAPVSGVTADAVYDGQKYIYSGAIPPTPAIVTGLDSNGAVDRRQSDEYKSIRAQYDQARKELPAAEARDKGLELWAQANPELAARLQKPTSNPLMERTFGYQTGQGPGQITMAPDQETVMGDSGSRAQGEGGYNYEALMAERARREQSPSPLVQQEMQQQATADQAPQATTAGMSTADKADELVKRFKTQPGAFPTQKLF